jgi:hypothetical protein
MPEPRPGEQPGHLDIDTVSAFVDRDLEIVDITILEQHLRECPACEREVLEIHATVLLLNTLPHYAPRRSFCLGQEHARAHRRRDRQQQAAYLPGSNPLTLPASTPSAPMSAPSFARWMPGLQVATLVTGVLLLLVTVGDLSGLLGSQPAPMQLAAPVAQDADSEAPMAAAPQESLEQTQEQESAPIPLLTATAAAAPAAAPALPDDAAGFAQGGTNSADDASDQVSESDDAPRMAARAIPTSATAAVTQAIPTPGVENPTVSTGATESGSTSGNERPTLVRIVQIALALLLGWLVVSMAGVQWIRRLR